MKIILALFLTTYSFLANGQSTWNFPLAPDSISVFGSGIISTGQYERDFALSPDGTEIFYTLQSPLAAFQTIVYCRKDKRGQWSKPALAPFAGKYRDLEPAFSQDGQRLYFSSDRPINGTTSKDVDIWYVDKKNGEWGEPINAGPVVNGPGDEYYPSITKSGNLYFTASYQDSYGKEDIYIARWQNGRFQQPEPLDTSVNSKTYEFNAFVSPDENFILFTSYGRKDDRGRGDLYASTKGPDGHWQKAVNLTAINSDRLDYCPFVSFDGQWLFFTSERNALQTSYPGKTSYENLITTFSSPGNGAGDIYWVRFKDVLPK